MITNSMNKKRLLITVLSAMMLVPCLYLAARNFPRLTILLGSFEEFRAYILDFGNEGIAVYVILQAVQVLVPAIPSEAVQSAGGYIFGSVFGSILSISGTLLGGAAAFYISRFLGKSVIKKVLNQRKLKEIEALLQHPRLYIVIFLIFLIPGMPKDIMNYVAGVSPVKAGIFIAISTLARLPGTIAAVYMGTTLQQGRFLSAAILFIFLLVAICTGIFAGKKLLSHFRAKANSIDE